MEMDCDDAFDRGEQLDSVGLVIFPGGEKSTEQTVAEEPIAAADPERGEKSTPHRGASIASFLAPKSMALDSAPSLATQEEDITMDEYRHGDTLGPLGTCLRSDDINEITIIIIITTTTARDDSHTTTALSKSVPEVTQAISEKNGAYFSTWFKRWLIGSRVMKNGFWHTVIRALAAVVALRNLLTQKLWVSGEMRLFPIPAVTCAYQVDPFISHRILNRVIFLIYSLESFQPEHDGHIRAARAVPKDSPLSNGLFLLLCISVVRLRKPTICHLALFGDWRWKHTALPQAGTTSIHLNSDGQRPTQHPQCVPKRALW